jgi:hypothetical protein
MAQHGVEVNASGIHNRLRRKGEGIGHGEQFAAHRADFGIHLGGVDQHLDKIGQQQNVRIQREDPVAARECNCLVLRGGETDVFLVVDDLASIFELFQDSGSVAPEPIPDSV